MAGMVGLRLRLRRVMGMPMLRFCRRILGRLRVSGLWRMLLSSLLILLVGGLMGLVRFVGFVRRRAPMRFALALLPSLRAHLRAAPVAA